MLGTSLRRSLLPAVLLIACGVSAAPAAAAPKTHVFRMDLNVSVDTTWESHTENQWCSDFRKVLHGNGTQLVQIRAKSMLVTLRGGRFSFPGTRGTMTMPFPGAGTATFAPMPGQVIRKAAYDLKWVGRADTCAPGNEQGGPAPDTDTCGAKTFKKGGQWGFARDGGTLKLLALTLIDDPYEGRCPAESSGAVTLPQPVTVYHGKTAWRDLQDPRKKTISIQGQSEDIKTDEPWGMGEVRWGEQTSDVMWRATFRRVG